jgi:hypothetical protein
MEEMAESGEWVGEWREWVKEYRSGKNYEGGRGRKNGEVEEYCGGRVGWRGGRTGEVGELERVGRGGGSR